MVMLITLLLWIIHVLDVIGIKPHFLYSLSFYKIRARQIFDRSQSVDYYLISHSHSIDLAQNLVIVSTHRGSYPLF